MSRSFRVELRAHGLAFGAWLLAAIFLLATRTQPIRLNWGDPLSDANVQTSGRYFANYGFARLGFTPVIDVGPLDETSLRYTHYPPLPDLVNGLLQKLGATDIATFRLVADVLTLASLYFFYRWARSLWGGIAANVAILLMATNFLWLQYADTIHHIPLYWSSGFATLFCAARWLATRQRWLLFTAAATTFVCDMASYDYFLFLPIAVLGTVVVAGHRPTDRAVRPIVAAVAFGVVAFLVVKFGLVALAIGPKNLIADFVFQLHERATGKHSTSFREALLPTIAWHALRFFTPVVGVVVGSQLVSFALRWTRRRENVLPPLSPLWLLAAGAPFVTVFSQLFVEQYHPTLQLLPYFAVSSGALVAWLWAKAAAGRGLAVGLVVLAVGWEVRETWVFEKTFFERSDIAVIHDYLERNDRRRVVFTNSAVDAPIRFYLERHVLGIGQSTKEDVEYFMRHFYWENGDEPVHYVEFADVEKSAFDKQLFAVFSNEKRWDWITNPVPHKTESLEALRKRGESAKRVFAEFGRLVVQTGRMKVYVLDREALSRADVAAISEETTRIDFARDDSNKHKITGLQFNEKDGDGVGFCWSTARQLYKYRFTMRGLLHEPDGPPQAVAALRLKSSPRRRTLRLGVHGGAEDQTVEIVWNTTVLGRVATPQKWTDVSFEVPAEAFVAEGLQRLEVRASKVNEHKVGVALREIRIDPFDGP